MRGELEAAFGAPSFTPGPVKSFADSLTGLATALSNANVIGGLGSALAPEHAPMLRTVIQWSRREKAQEVERYRANASDPKVIAALEGRLAPFQQLIKEQWFIEATPYRVPKSADYLTLQRLAVVTQRGSPTTPTFEDKFHILYAPSTLLPELARSRDDCSSRNLPVSVVFLDLDNFKSLNTTYGEPRVDADLLPVFMRLVERTVFGHGQAYRYGGDEIVLLLPNCTSALALALLDQLRGSLASAPYAGIPERPTISCGVCVVDSDSPLTDRETLERAAHAKKFAKEKPGKNGIASYSTPLCRDEDLMLLTSATAGESPG